MGKKRGLGQEGYGRWERKEQEVVGKSGLEVGEKVGKYTTLLTIMPSKKGKERE